MRVAIAGRFAERHLITARLPQVDGVDYVADWLDAVGSDADLSDQAACEQVSANAGNVARSHLLLYIGSPVPSPGRLIDLGMAIGRGVPVLCVTLSGDLAEHSIYLRGVRQTTWEALPEVLAEIVQEWES